MWQRIRNTFGYKSHFFFHKQLRRGIANGEMEKVIERVENEGAQIRAMLNDIVLYTEGAYNIKDLYIMPTYFLKEILDRLESKNKKIEEEMSKSQGNRKTYF